MDFILSILKLIWYIILLYIIPYIIIIGIAIFVIGWICIGISKLRRVK